MNGIPDGLTAAEQAEAVETVWYGNAYIELKNDAWLRLKDYYNTTK